MATVTVHARLPLAVEKGLEELVREGNYSSIAEAMRDAARRLVEERQIKKLAAELEKIRGSNPKIGKITRKDRKAAAEELFRTDSSEIFRKVGL
ncbi:MAG: ribbon-helix-helix protein, CopG family [Candidatus Micrarchaeota archaeon]